MTERSETVPATLAGDEQSAVPTPGIPLLVGVLQSLVGPSTVLYVPVAEAASAIAAGETIDPDIPELTIAALEESVRAWLAAGSNPFGHEAVTIVPGRQLFMAESLTSSGDRVGAVAVARRGEAATSWSDGEITTIRKFAGLCGSSIVVAGTEPRAPSRRRLDDLVTRVAVELMPVSAASLDDALVWTLQTLGDFFAVDTSYLRRNDFDRGTSVLVAEWPPRENVPDPDPLGEVPFDADPVFAAIRDLKEPFVMRPATSPDAYQERVQQGSGIDQVSMAM
ncbi:MAG TPA: hypothetical protein VKQ71_02065, partial [Acidimicrobiales bacterium]|nr:hypothetical protein [Acidimicrobiales bacterium]